MPKLREIFPKTAKSAYKGAKNAIKRHPFSFALAGHTLASGGLSSIHPGTTGLAIGAAIADVGVRNISKGLTKLQKYRMAKAKANVDLHAGRLQQAIQNKDRPAMYIHDMAHQAAEKKLRKLKKP